MRRENDFDKLLLRTIDNSLKEVFDETATSAIYAYLENNYALNAKEIPEKLDVFIDGLHKFLSSGAYAVEQVILENLCSNLRMEIQAKEERDFKSSIIQLKSCLKLR